MKSKLLFFLLFSLTQLTVAQNGILSDSSKISIFTCGKGEELYTTFGHTAIRIKDEINQIDVVFNYGQFDFREGNFYLKFVKGNLQYCIGVAAYQDFIYEYQYEKREVIEQTLHLSQKQKQQLFDALLASQYTLEESHYTYKFIDRNCTTMVVEKINAVLGKQLINKVDNKSISYREVLYPKFENYFWYKLGINIIFGSKVDVKSEKLFLPQELLNSLDQLKMDGKLLVEKKKTVVKSDQPKMEFSFLNSIYFVALLLVFLFFANHKFVTNTYFIVAGLLGIFLCSVGLYTLHQELLWNYNALLFNPLFVLLPILKNKKALHFTVITCLVVVFGYFMFMLNKPHFILMLPFILLHFALLLRKFKKGYYRA